MILYTLFKINSFNTDNEIINNLFIILYPFLVFIISILKYIDILKYITDFPGNIIVFSIILTLITISNLIYLYNTKHFPYIQFCIYIILTILYILDFLINKKEYTLSNMSWVVVLPGLIITLGQNNIYSTISSIIFLSILTCELFINDIKNVMS